MDRKPTIGVMLPGETFSRRWVNNWTKLVVATITNGYDPSPLFGYSSNPHITRAALAAEAERCAVPLDYLLWIDDDNLVEPQHVLKLLDVLEKSPQIDMVCGWCFIEGNEAEGRPARVSCGRLKPHLLTESFSPAEMAQAAHAGKLMQVDWTGFPLVLMRFGTLAKAGRHPFAAILADHLRYGQTGEDVAFCIKAQERGGAMIVVDPSVKVEHLKVQPVPDPVERAAIDLSNLGARASGLQRMEK